MRMEPNFDKANEIYFRLGIIYKQQQKYQQSLEVIVTLLINNTQQCADFVVLPVHCERSAPSAH